MLKKLYDKDPVWFAVLWIVLYVVGFSAADAASDAIGISKLITAAVGLAMSAVLLAFAKKHGLLRRCGLVRFDGSGKKYLYFLPLIVISSVNFWNGVTAPEGLLTSICFVVSMCCVAFLEEVIFRGLLFRGMCDGGNVKTAILVCSLTFGIGHAVNLLNGAPVFETLLQLVYASAIGFCYTAIVYRSGSLLPCILSHAVVNSTSLVGAECAPWMLAVIAAAQTVLGVGYGIWVLKKVPAETE